MSVTVESATGPHRRMDRRQRRRARADPRAPWSNPGPSSTSARWRSHAPVEFLTSRSSYGPPSQKEDAMKYMLLIHQGTTPLPGTPEWEALSQEEQGQVYAAYKALNETPGVTPGQQMQGPETATTVRVQDGRTLTTDGPFAELKEAIG